jgi:hypothetical protein
LFVFPHNEVYDEPQETPDEYNNEPERAVHSPGFGVSVDPDAEEDGDDEPEDRDSADPAKDEPLDLFDR